MKTEFESENDYDNFKVDIKKRLQNWKIREINIPGYRQAAVFMLLMNKDNRVHVLLTKRTDRVETHKGQISFPGGVSDESDEDILNTAFRETYEEVGIQRENIELLGRFDDFISISGFNVTTFIGSVVYPVKYIFSHDEIDDYVEAPFSMFLNLEHDKIEYYSHQGREVKVYFYKFKGYEIWGLTARILTDFAKKVCL